MRRYLRFVVRQQGRGRAGRVGVFTAAYALLRESDLPAPDLARLGASLAWFEAELTVPPKGAIPEGAVFWYDDASPFTRRMWELVYLLRECGLVAEPIEARYIGRVVYRDEHQYAAHP